MGGFPKLGVVFKVSFTGIILETNINQEYTTVYTQRICITD